MRVVFDTNVLLSSRLSNRGASFELLRLAAAGTLSGHTSQVLLDEFREIARRDYAFSPALLNSFVNDFLQILKIVEPGPKLSVVNDDDDNRVLEVAVAAKADFIASFDKHLLSLKEYRGILILPPGEILQKLRQTSKT